MAQEILLREEMLSTRIGVRKVKTSHSMALGSTVGIGINSKSCVAFES